MTESCLLDSQPNVRFAAKRLLASLLLGLNENQLLPLVIKYKKVGLTMKKLMQEKIAKEAREKLSNSTTNNQENDQKLTLPVSALNEVSDVVEIEMKKQEQLTFQSVQCLTTLLVVCSDFSTPMPITGKVIEAIAVFSKGKFFKEVVVKEAQSSFQTFLKQQQSGELGWKECKKN